MAIPREDFESIVHTHQAMLYRVAFNFLRNVHLAEEIVQDVFLELHRTMPSLDS
jgi:DNA-directed RNA polymerase specialized sigma24 family protein